jgi:hypothetical protein
MAQLPP